MELDRIRKLRVEKSISQVKMAEKLGMKVEDLRAIELCRTIPSIETLIHIADYLNISLDYITGRTKERLEIGEKPFLSGLTKEQKQIVRETVEKYREITYLENKKKRDLKEQEEKEKRLRRRHLNCRKLERWVRIFKFINTRPGTFTRQLNKGTSENGERYTLQELVTEINIKESFLSWLNRQSIMNDAIDYRHFPSATNSGFRSFNYDIVQLFHFRKNEEGRICFTYQLNKNHLTKLIDDYNGVNDDIVKLSLTLLDQIDKFEELEEEVDFDVEGWLNPTFEWSLSNNDIAHFKLIDFNREMTLFEISAKNINYIENKSWGWTGKMNSGNDFPDISHYSLEEFLNKTGGRVEPNCYFFTDRDEKTKFFYFLKELFDSDGFVYEPKIEEEPKIKVIKLK